jgi:hypothetical protein
MKFWIGGALVGMLAFSFAGCGGSSDYSATQTQLPASVTSAPTLPISCGEKTCVPTAPTATAPASCGFGSGEWEQCAKTAVDPAFQDYLSRFPQDTSGPESFELAIFIEERVDWPDSCLGVDTPGVLCL